MQDHSVLGRDVPYQEFLEQQAELLFANQDNFVLVPSCLDGTVLCCSNRCTARTI